MGEAFKLLRRVNVVIATTENSAKELSVSAQLLLNVTGHLTKFQQTGGQWRIEQVCVYMDMTCNTET